MHDPDELYTLSRDTDGVLHLDMATKASAADTAPLDDTEVAEVLEVSTDLDTVGRAAVDLLCQRMGWPPAP
ncbi:hypothetical protein [Nocardiopsis synnemataformans]|uniref:hypothetical protein n=1 Tax=Nocardiopsis synnemataformans TaxID=61305 RepID=UPI003EBBD2A5